MKNKTNITRVFLDMDGCIVNLQKGIDILLKSKGYTRDYTKPMFKEEMENEYNISSNTFWRIIDEGGAKFWADLEPFPWYKDLYNICKTFCKDVTIMSTPSLDSYSAAGKIMWLNKHLGNGRAFRDYTLTVRKDLFAEPHTLLIDDRFCVTNKFLDAGGQVFLIPQFYNCNTALIDTEEELLKLQKYQIYEHLPKFLKERTQ